MRSSTTRTSSSLAASTSGPATTMSGSSAWRTRLGRRWRRPPMRRAAACLSPVPTSQRPALARASSSLAAMEGQARSLGTCGCSTPPMEPIAGRTSPPSSRARVSPSLFGRLMVKMFIYLGSGRSDKLGSCIPDTAPFRLQARLLALTTVASSTPSPPTATPLTSC